MLGLRRKQGNRSKLSVRSTSRSACEVTRKAEEKLADEEGSRKKHQKGQIKAIPREQISDYQNNCRNDNERKKGKRL